MLYRKALKSILLTAWHVYAQFIGNVTRRYYVEDYVRVYPDGLVLNRLGFTKEATAFHLNNFLNHRKFYLLASQFVNGCRVADIGCGSGYGAALLKEAGASLVEGADISRHAIAYATAHYSHLARFSIQNATKLARYADEQFDVVVCSEVLEHLKEYERERAAVAEMNRVLKPGGLLVLGTPNSEMLPDHGFEFEELRTLMLGTFPAVCIFENALVPEGQGRSRWERRAAEGRHGILVEQDIDLSETALLNRAEPPQIKRGSEGGVIRVLGIDVDTSLLHNTHSWVVLARK